MNEILLGDCRELIQSIPDDSVDLIFTDPPYDKESVPLYAWLAEAAARVLKPGGFCFAYCGVMYLDEIMCMMREHLTYYWQFLNLQLGAAPLVHARKIQQNYKPILGFSKGPGVPGCYTNDIYINKYVAKKYHKWEQTTGTAAYFIDRFSSPGDIVLEPFAGGGTTCIAAMQEGRNFIAFEKEEKHYNTVKERLQLWQPKLLTSFHEQLELTETSVKNT